MTALYVSLKKLYEKDENLWLFQNAELIRSGQINEADWENIAEELESMQQSISKLLMRELQIWLPPKPTLFTLDQAVSEEYWPD